MKGLSQENMAMELGITQQGYSRLERSEGKMKLGHLLRIAEILGVGIESLLGTTPLFPEKNPQPIDHGIRVLKEEVDSLREKVRLRTILQPPPLPHFD